MPENIVVTLKQSGGGFWPFVRGTFALIGFGVTVGAGVAAIEDGRNVHDAGKVIEAFAAGWRAGEAAYQAQANPYDDLPFPDAPALPDTHWKTGITQ